MRRLMAPLAMASAACTMRPWTPSVAVAYWAEDVPDARTTQLPSSQALFARWQLGPANPWAPFSKPTLPSAADAMRPRADLPDVRLLDVVSSASAAATRLASVGLPDGTIWLVDLRGAGSVAFAATLARASRQAVAPVLTFNNWPAEEEMVPAEETLAALVSFDPGPLPPEGGAPVFLLDAWRLAFRYDTPDDDTADNRYMLGPADFPGATALRERGIRRAVYVVESRDDADREDDDLHATMLAWQSAGVGVYLVDLPFLRDLPSPARWDELLADQALVLKPRATIVDDPTFYERARGGFGGVFGHPLLGPGFHGHWHGGGGHGGHGGGHGGGRGGHGGGHVGHGGGHGHGG